jgi:transcriptional regulator with XRE-family HTH domain
MARPLRRLRRRPSKYPNLRAYLAQSGDTQEQIARALGISQAQVSRILAGKVVPRPALAIRLASYAQIPVDSFTWEAARQQKDAR